MKGRVKWWSEEKGYGFIEYNENEDVFAHIDEESNKQYPITENQEIEFTTEEKNNSIYLHILKIIEN